MALADSESSSSDDSFGDQVILKSQPRMPTFAISADASIFYTNNVALTRRGQIDDSFLVAHVGGNWTPRIAAGLDGQFGVSVATFRYNDTSALDFTNLSFGGGLYWTPVKLGGITLFSRYDFIELLNRDSDEILQDHEFTLGAQKVFALGRSHSFTVGAIGMAGITSPKSAQRNQAGVFVGYRALLTRALEMELLYRGAFFSYSDSSRDDFNQVVSLSLRYHFTPWAEANAFLSYGDNRSDQSAFDYRVLTTGAGVGATVRF